MPWLPTLGGQTALNTALQVADTGILEELNIEMIGADREVIRRAEDRDIFRETMRKRRKSRNGAGGQNFLFARVDFLKQYGRISRTR
jgi:hypothetical protein